jgi:hypothetical protein
MIEFKIESEGNQIILYWRRDCWVLTEWNHGVACNSEEEVEVAKKAILDRKQLPKTNEDDDSIPF